MRDLEIRGAGNLLGGEQSGYIMEMGFEMYERIVREAVEEIKQEEFKDVFNKGSLPAAVGATETVVESDIEALIPDFYVEADSERLDIYRRLYRASEAEELRSMRDELRDRFGEYPAEVENLFRLVELRLAASKAGYPKISVRGGLLTLTLPDASSERFYGKSGDTTAPFQRIMEEISRDKKKRAQLRQFGKELALEFPLQEAQDVNKRLEEARATLERIVVMTTVLSS
jgi:transcription-repair coupling factor (superfamily II helicase)